MAAQDLQILVVVDLYPGVSVDELKQALPVERDERVVRLLTEHGAPRLAPPPDTSPIDWSAIGRAIERVAADVHALQASTTRPTVVFVAGKGPLAAFTHLGYKFTKSIQRVVVLNQPPGGGPWEQFPIESAESEAPALLDVIEGLPAEPAVSDGRLAISIDTAGRSTDKDVFLGFLRSQGAPIAGVVQLRSSQKLLVKPDTMGALARQLAQFMSMAPSRYPSRSGLAIFVGGPVQVAFAIGRAMSPNVIGKDVWLTEYRSPRYERAYQLPFAASSEPSVPMDDTAKLARRKVLDAMVEGINELKGELSAEHLPTGLLPEADRDKFITRLRELRFSVETKEEEPFELRVIEGRVTLANAAMLQALVHSTQEQRKSFAKLLLLHELIHDWQTLRSTNYTSIGRACFVLEQVDYAADVFALQTLVNLDLAAGGFRAHKELSQRLRTWIEMILHGIEAFDLMEQGLKMERLPERRLRRYLLWHLQFARAATVRQASEVEEMLRPSLTVELAPLAGHIDTERHDKVVTHALPDTEIFIAIGGHLVRAPRRAGFEPGTLVESVRTYARGPIQDRMVQVVDEHRAKLAPWRA